MEPMLIVYLALITPAVVAFIYLVGAVCDFFSGSW